MKTRFKIGGFLIILLISIWGWMQNREKQSDYLLFNIEALANGEWSGGDCHSVGSVDYCPRNNGKVYMVLR